MAKEKTIEEIEKEAESKGWIVEGISTKKPIDCYLSKKDYQRWEELKGYRKRR